jgi:hypothetical protein
MQRVRAAEPQPGLLLDLAHAREPVGEVALLAGVHGAAREHPRAAHEPLGGIALDQEDLERLRAAAQDDHGRRLTRLDRRRAKVELLPGTGPVDLHQARG